MQVSHPRYINWTVGTNSKHLTYNGKGEVRQKNHVRITQQFHRGLEIDPPDNTSRTKRSAKIPITDQVSSPKRNTIAIAEENLQLDDDLISPHRSDDTIGLTTMP